VPSLLSVGSVQWPPRIGDVLPRAEDAWCTQAKLVDWILAEHGHANQWRRVFHVEAEDADQVWELIAEAVLTAPITALRGDGTRTSYGVLINVTVNDRFAPVLTAWHYEHEGAAPRLVTAYPKPYTRRNGDYG
jgi:hypothetical protein